MELYQERANKWKNSPTLDEKLKQELLSMNDDELKDAFYTDLEFGTGGMRGIMGVGTNRLNTIIITKATLGFANYLLKENKNANFKQNKRGTNPSIVCFIK